MTHLSRISPDIARRVLLPARFGGENRTTEVPRLTTGTPLTAYL
ncbi:hypothetical protein EES42_06725 [Streptomyces sp. ADI95-17]|nr:hypothetical protein EES42_06725 [Streptomyces sp. ADI95-17]